MGGKCVRGQVMVGVGGCGVCVEGTGVGGCGWDVRRREVGLVCACGEGFNSSFLTCGTCVCGCVCERYACPCRGVRGGWAWVSGRAGGWMRGGQGMSARVQERREKRRTVGVV